MTEEAFNEWLDGLESSIRNSGYLGRRMACGTTPNGNTIKVKKNATGVVWTINNERSNRQYLYIIDQES